jgi:iron complex outermembrane receptor protein
MHKTNRLIQGALGAILAGAIVQNVSIAAPSEDSVATKLASAAQTKVYFQIDAPKLSRALIQLTEQSGMQLIYPAVAAAADLPAEPINGSYTTTEALEKLLRGTGLKYEFIDARTISVFDGQTANVARTTRVSMQTDPGVLRLASNESENSALGSNDAVSGTFGSGSDAAPSRRRKSTARADDLEQVIVTGTNIRGVSDQFSPVITATRDDLDRRGVATAGEYIAQLPQHFGGTVAPDTAVGSSVGAGSAAVNLRGLGAQATLVLLNGRRMAPSGLEGEFADVAAIPTSALERVDVLTDGASAVYGSDAVAGVVNFVLRKDYNGAESRVRVGRMSGSDSYQLGQTFGISNERGRALLSYEYSSEEALDANDRSFTRDQQDPYEILPDNKRHSVFFSGAVSLTDGLELFADAFMTDREAKQVFTVFSITENVTETRTYGGTLGGRMDLGAGWQAELAGSIAENEFDLYNYFRPFRDGQYSGNDSRIWAVDGKIDGGLFDISGGTVRAVLGAQYREERHDGGSDFFDADGNSLNYPQRVVENTRNVSAVFAEIYAPLIGASNAKPGAQSLALSLATRYEEYSDFGSSFTPKFGLAWSPLEGVTLRGTYGRSFHAPQLSVLIDDINYMGLIDYLDPESPGGKVVAAMPVGYRQDLDAEKSRSWSVGIDWQPAFAPGLDARLTYFDIDYTGRIGYPFARLNADTYEWYDFPLGIQRNVDPAIIQDLFVRAGGRLANYTEYSPDGVTYSLSDATAIVDSRMTNTSSSRVSGLDLSLAYGLPLANGRLQFSMNGSYLFESKDQFAPTQPVVSKLGRVSSPTRLRAMGGAMWSHGAISTSLNTRFWSSYKDDLPTTPRRVSSWTIFDLSFQYDFERGAAPAPLAGTKLTLTVQNVLDKDPPTITTFLAPGLSPREISYDAQNADPQGRVFALQITKQWGGR